MRPITLAVSAAIALSPAAALAAPAAASGVVADARCLLAMGAFSGASDANTARTAQAAVIYFTGRIKAADPSFNFATRLKPIAAGMTPQGMATEAQQRCGPMFMQAARELDAAQSALNPPAAASAPPKAAGAPPKP